MAAAGYACAGLRFRADLAGSVCAAGAAVCLRDAELASQGAESAVYLKTMRIHSRKSFCPILVLACLWLPGCVSRKPETAVTVTLKRDGSQTTGTVVRRETNSITLADSDGGVHTFLFSEIADMKEVLNGNGRPGPSGSTASGGSDRPGTGGPAEKSQSSVGAAGAIVLPSGTAFPVVTSWMIDTCCMPEGFYAPGTVDEDVSVGGKVVIPQGASVTTVVADKKTADGRKSIRFEVGAVEFGGHHYTIESGKGGLEQGLTVSYTGAKEGSPEAKVHGLEVHVDSGSLMEFKAVSPTVVKPEP